MADKTISSLQDVLRRLTEKRFAPLDFLSAGSLTERALSLVLGEKPPLMPDTDCGREWQKLAQGLRSFEVSGRRAVALGGGTGLSRIVGGDSRRPEWRDQPFSGLKEIFPNLTSIVCVTDDGGSTGEMLKDFPLISLGDIRHVLLSSVRSAGLQELYRLDEDKAAQAAAVLHSLFNFRFSLPPDSPEQLWKQSGATSELLPKPLADGLSDLMRRLFSDQRLKASLQRPQCLGNLLIAAAVYSKLPAFFRIAELIANQKRLQAATLEGISDLAHLVGAGRNAVLPCALTSAQLQVLYANGVQVMGEAKAGLAERGWPVERVNVRFCEEPRLPEQAAEALQRADIIIFAPGSLYTSIIPILQTPGLADLVRSNKKALKLLIGNIWVQEGETDATLDAPDKRFHVSDLIRAYDHNIPGGTQDLFSHVLVLDMADVPGSVLQNYALEKKEPIYVDSSKVRQLHFEPVQARIFSRELLRQEQVVQHDPAALAAAVRCLCGLRASGFLDVQPPPTVRITQEPQPVNICPDRLLPCIRHEEISRIVRTLSFRQFNLLSEQANDMEPEEREQLAAAVIDILWRHPDIRPDHLRAVQGISLISTARWSRCQQWDSIFSFYDPEDGCLKIRQDQVEEQNLLEMPLLVALGQSLLGNYCEEKQLEPVLFHGQQVGRIYWLAVRERQELNGFLSGEELDEFLQLAQLTRLAKQRRLYARTVNGEEGFMPPGLLFGQLFAWYLDNRFALNIDHAMMPPLKNETAGLVVKQTETARRQEKLITFFRERVFRARKV